MDDLGHDNKELHQEISEGQIKDLANALGVPAKDVINVVGDLIDMGLLRITGPGEWEVLDGSRWRKIRI